MVQRASAAVVGFKRFCAITPLHLSRRRRRGANSPLEAHARPTRAGSRAPHDRSPRAPAPRSPARRRRADGRDGHATLSIDLHLVGTRCPESRPVPVGASRLGPLLHDSHLPIEFPRGPQGQATLGLLGQISAPLELGTEFGGQDHPALDIERMLVSPHESCHWPDLPRRSLNCVLERPSTPFRATLRPFPPPSNHFNPHRSHRRPSNQSTATTPSSHREEEALTVRWCSSRGRSPVISPQWRPASRVSRGPTLEGPRERPL